MTRQEAIKALGIEQMSHTTGGIVFTALGMAISALREQEDHIREVTKMVGWISVEDRLPKRSTPVLCCTEDGGMFVGVDWLDWPDGTVTFKQYKSSYWPDATHWMPLPELPV